MGFNTTANTLSITARLTPNGRALIASNTNTLITKFSLSDSDANYNATLPLTSGQVPSDGGNIGPNSTVSNSVNSNMNFKSFLLLNSSGEIKKNVEPESLNIITEPKLNGSVSVSGSNLTQDIINRNDYITDSLVNLFYSFGLPVSSSDDTQYTATTYTNGGYADTALSGLAQTNILAFGIDNSQYGECIDGKTIKFILPTTGGTFNIYSTFQNKALPLTSEDANYRDTSVEAQVLGNNIAYLFSDEILRPNGGDASLSWASGNGTVKPFSLNGKKLFNLQTDTSLSLSADTPVGVAYLDKGFLVITHPTILSGYGVYDQTGVTTGASVTFDSVSTSVYQNITCIASRGEFGSSSNPTFTGIEYPRISEIGLYDDYDNLIAVGKTDRHIARNINDFLAIGVSILL